MVYNGFNKILRVRPMAACFLPVAENDSFCRIGN